MILYLSSDQHTNLLDFTAGSDMEKQTMIKKMVGNFVLKQFVIYVMRNFSHFTDVVLDRVAFHDSDGEFVEAIEEFLTMYSPRITVICEGISQSDSLFTSLLECEVGNIVCHTEIMDIQQEIRECLSEMGMVRYQSRVRPARLDNYEKYQFDCENIVIAVVGSQMRVGTTTAAIGLCTWLAHAGASVCYVEANQSGHLAILARSYGMEQVDDGWQFKGVPYRLDKPDRDVNFIVYDLGKGLGERCEILDGADIKLLVCGTKPYELGYMRHLQAGMAGIDAYLFCPFVADEIKGDLIDILQNDYHKVLFSDYKPEPTSGDGNARHYKTLIAEYIARV